MRFISQEIEVRKEMIRCFSFWRVDAPQLGNWLEIPQLRVVTLENVIILVDVRQMNKVFGRLLLSLVRVL